MLAIRFPEGLVLLKKKNIKSFSQKQQCNTTCSLTGQKWSRRATTLTDWIPERQRRLNRIKTFTSSPLLKRIVERRLLGLIESHARRRSSSLPADWPGAARGVGRREGWRWGGGGGTAAAAAAAATAASQLALKWSEAMKRKRKEGEREWESETCLFMGAWSLTGVAWRRPSSGTAARCYWYSQNGWKFAFWCGWKTGAVIAGEEGGWGGGE